MVSVCGEITEMFGHLLRPYPVTGNALARPRYLDNFRVDLNDERAEAVGDRLSLHA